MGNTMLVDVVFALSKLVTVHTRSYPGLLSYGREAFRQDDKLVARDIVFFDGLGDDLF
jgi:hypothetical protein